MKKLFICEKPSQAKHILKTLGSKDDSALISPSIAAYKFDYLKNIPYQDIPICKTPKYKQILPDYGHFGHVYIKDGSDIIRVEQPDIKELYNCFSYLNGDKRITQFYKKEDIFDKQQAARSYLENFDEIIYACDPDYTGVRGFSFLFKMFFGYFNYKKQLKTKISTASFYSFSENDLKNEFNDRKDLINDLGFLGLEESYKKKDLFEHSFNLNSMVLFGDILRNIGIYQNIIITKNMLLTLMLIDSASKITDSNLVKQMEQNEIGSNASRAEIIKILYDIGLVYWGIYREKDKNIQYNILTKEGIEFLDNIHPKVKDPKMAIRLKEQVYGNLTSEEFEPYVEEKIKLMFSKQKRFFRKRLLKQLELNDNKRDD